MPAQQPKATEELVEVAFVSADRLNRRTCPSTACGVVGWLSLNTRVEMLEERNGWARISKYYDASCVDGRSEYVDRGNAECVAANGIRQGRFAEWVSSDYLALERAETSGTEDRIFSLVDRSDDFRRHRDAFLAAARAMIEDGRCTAAGFREWGGWTAAQRAKTYFIYCGGDTRSNRYYLDVGTGRIVQ